MEKYLTIQNLILCYWTVTTIVTAYHFAVNDYRNNEDENITMLHFFGNLFPALIVGWACVPCYFLSKIVIKKGESDCRVNI